MLSPQGQSQDSPFRCQSAQKEDDKRGAILYIKIDGEAEKEGSRSMFCDSDRVVWSCIDLGISNFSEGKLSV